MILDLFIVFAYTQYPSEVRQQSRWICPSAHVLTGHGMRLCFFGVTMILEAKLVVTLANHTLNQSQDVREHLNRVRIW